MKTTIIFCLLIYSILQPSSESLRKLSGDVTINSLKVEPSNNLISSYPQKGWLVVKNGTRVTLECYGLEPVQWKYVEETIYYKHRFNEEPNITNNIKLVRDVNNQSHERKLFVSKMEVMLESMNDTKKITCALGNTSDWNLELNSNPEIEEVKEDEVMRRGEDAILIFVYDGVNLLVPVTGSKQRIVVDSMSTTIPCRPTHPWASIFFHNNNKPPGTIASRQIINKKKIGEIPMIKADYDFTFDLTKGFHVPQVGKFLSGIFFCRAVFGNVVSVAMLNYSYRVEQVPEVRIQSPRLDWLVGETLSFRCTGRIKDLTSLTFNLLPSSNKSINERLHTVLKIIENSKHLTEIDVAMEVRDLNIADSGLYYCFVHDDHSINKKMNNASIRIKVHEKAFVNLDASPAMKIQTVSPKMDKVHLKADVYACPDPYFEWFKNDLPLVNNLRISAKANELSIYHPNPSDTGIYKLEASASNATSSLVFSLTVKVPPTNRITNQNQVYLINSAHHLLCQFDGVPTPIIWWKWSPCSDAITCSSSPPIHDDRWVLPQATPNFQYEPIQDNRVSNITVIAIETGHYICMVMNSEGNHTAEYLFIVTDIEGGHDIGIIKDPPTEIVVGDEVTLSCWVNSVTFDTESIKWLYRDLKIDSYLHEFKEKKEIQLNKTKTKHSSIHVLMFTSVNFTDDATYFCSASYQPGIKRNDDSSSSSSLPVEYRIKVMPIKHPLFTKSLSENTPTHLNSSIALTCIASGRPHPIIEWFKNSQPITEQPIQQYQLTNGSKDLNKYLLKNDGTTLYINSVTTKDESSYECRATNKGGIASSSTKLMVVDAVIAQSSVTEVNHRRMKMVAMVISLTFGITLILTLASFCVACKKFKKLRRMANLKHLEKMLTSTPGDVRYNPDVPLDEQTHLLSYDHSMWEIDLERIQFGAILGSGAFGQVYKARLSGKEGKSMVVAVKTIRDAGDVPQLKSLISELKVLIHLGCHDNVLRVFGAATKDIRKGNLYVIMEYCCYGNLKSFLLLRSKNARKSGGEKVKRHPVHQLTGGCHGDIDDFTKPLLNAVSPARLSSDCVNDVELLESELTTLMDMHEMEKLGKDSNSFIRDIINGCESMEFGKKMSGMKEESLKEETTDHKFIKSIQNNNKYNRNVDNENIENNLKFNKIYDDNVDQKWEELTKRHLYDFALQIARGLEFLSSRKYIHRDLAARNILVSSNNVMKICDFGLAKGCYRDTEYQKKSDTPVPVKWMALESLTKNIYTLQSDVWSFGVLLWEIFSLGMNPYAGQEFDYHFVDKLENGFRLTIPEAADDQIYNLMISCWSKEPNHRPTAPQLVQFITIIIANRQDPDLHLKPKEHEPRLNISKARPIQPSMKCYQNVPLIPCYENDSIPYFVISHGKTLCSFKSKAVADYKCPDNPYLAPITSKDGELVVSQSLNDRSKEELMKTGIGNCDAFSSTEENDVFRDDEDEDVNDFEIKGLNDCHGEAKIKLVRKKSCTSEISREKKELCNYPNVGRKMGSLNNCQSKSRIQKMSTESGIYSMGSKNSLPKNESFQRPSYDDDEEFDACDDAQRFKPNSFPETEEFLKKVDEDSYKIIADGGLSR